MTSATSTIAFAIAPFNGICVSKFRRDCIKDGGGDVNGGLGCSSIAHTTSFFIFTYALRLSYCQY